MNFPLKSTVLLFLASFYNFSVQRREFLFSSKILHKFPNVDQNNYPQHLRKRTMRITVCTYESSNKMHRKKNNNNNHHRHPINSTKPNHAQHRHHNTILVFRQKASLKKKHTRNTNLSRKNLAVKSANAKYKATIKCSALGRPLCSKIEHILSHEWIDETSRSNNKWCWIEREWGQTMAAKKAEILVKLYGGRSEANRQLAKCTDAEFVVYILIWADPTMTSR